MKVNRKYLWTAAAAGCALVAVLASGLFRRSAEEEGGVGIPVAVSVVRKGSITDELSLTGNIEAASDVDLYSKVSGRLEELKKDAGDEVKEGEVVARIDDQDLEARLNQARAEVDVARAELKKAGADLHREKRARDRVLRLFESGVESEDLFDKADTAYKSALAAYELGESNVWNREAHLEQDRILLNETTIESPVNGFVAKKYVDTGSMIAATTPILKVVNIDTVDVVVSVPEVKLSAVKVGSPAAIRVDAYPLEDFSGKIVRISPWVDLKTRSSAVEVAIANPAHHLKPGMFARVTLEIEQREDVPLIPKDAVLLVGGNTAVFVVEGGAARSRKVRTGMERGNVVEVLEGLEGGERLIVRGQSVVSEGSAVEVVREEGFL